MNSRTNLLLQTSRTPKKGCRPFPQPAPKLLSLCRHEDWCIYTVTRDGEMIEGCNADTDRSREKLHPHLVFSSEAHLMAFSAGADLGAKGASILHSIHPSLELSLFPQPLKIAVLWVRRTRRTQMLSSPGAGIALGCPQLSCRVA